MAMHQVTAHLPIGVGAGVVEIRTISELFGGATEKHTHCPPPPRAG